jgi:hypothetical protein
MSESTIKVTGDPGDSPCILDVYVAAHVCAKLTPTQMSTAAQEVDAVLAGHTPDGRVQILAFMLMAALGIRIERST